jgi:hypothetical protein
MGFPCPLSSEIAFQPTSAGSKFSSARVPAEQVGPAMRSLRRDLDRCQACSQGRGCPVMQAFNAIVTQAVHEVNQELVDV